MLIVLVVAMRLVAAGAATPTPTVNTPDAWHVGPVPQVRAICHAGDSLWVGTNVGVFVVDIRDPSRRTRIPAGPQLPSNSVRAIQSRGDSVWVATDTGVSVFSQGKVVVLSARDAGAKDGVPLRDVQQITFGNQGEVLLATRRGGVGVLTGSGAFAITKRDSLIDDNVYDILERPGRPRLFACGAGMCAQLDDTTMVSLQAGAGFPRGEARQVVGDDQTAYVRIARRGVFRFDGMHATALDAPGELSLTDVTSISLGVDHALWVTAPGGAWVWRAGKWKRVPVPALDWQVIVADGAGAFVGSSDGVVLAVNRGADFKLSLGDGLPGPSVGSLRCDGKGGAWFVSGSRVVNAGSVTRSLTVEKAPLDAEAVDYSPDGTLVAVGRWTVSRRDNTGWTDLMPRLPDADPAFASVFLDGRLMWVGTRSGALYRWDGEIWLRYEQPWTRPGAVYDARAYPGADWAIVGTRPSRGGDGIWSEFADWDSSAVVVDVARSPTGDWMAATSTRVFLYDTGRASWQAVGPAGQPSKAPWETPGAITSITFDATGRLFVGTADGLGYFAEGRMKWMTVADGIGGERVNDLAADAGLLWVGYDRDGFSVLPLASLR